MATLLQSFEIIGLYHKYNYHMNFCDNKLIVVGENGAGKTTIFKIMYYSLICDWDSLRTFEFEKINIAFGNGDTISVESGLLNNLISVVDFDYDKRYRRRRIVNDINTILQIKKRMIDDGIQESWIKYDLDMMPTKYYQEILDDENIEQLFQITRQIEERFTATILYLPTYRRIEEQLTSIFPEFEREGWEKARKRRNKNEKAIELIEFGMIDVDNAVKEWQGHLSEFSRMHQNKVTLGYLSEIIGKAYEKVDINEIMSLDDGQIKDILGRIDSSILSDAQKEAITQILINVRKTCKAPNEVHEKIICHYFLKLIAFDKEVSREESSLLNFITICNKYLVFNELIYDSNTFSCKIYEKTPSGRVVSEEEIRFQDLSSGEKQIVSLFNHLNLTDKTELFVFIDEPELSLSVEWQRMLLEDILECSSCVGLFATTHSPFVFDNSLEQYVHGINEFLMEE